MVAPADDVGEGEVSGRLEPGTEQLGDETVAKPLVDMVPPVRVGPLLQ